MQKATEFFDKKFVYAACAIGAAYALIIAGLGSLLGAQAAGVAGVALTALATAIFKQFETLRFKTIAEQEERTVSIPRLNIPYLLLLVCAFQGIQLFLGLLFGIIINSFGWLKVTPSTTLQSFGAIMSDYRMWVATPWPDSSQLLYRWVSLWEDSTEGQLFLRVNWVDSFSSRSSEFADNQGYGARLAWSTFHAYQSGLLRLRHLLGRLRGLCFSWCTRWVSWQDAVSRAT
jgi:hypothetical protein